MTLENISRTARVVGSYLHNNQMHPDELGALIHSVHRTFTGLGQPQAPEPAPRPKPAVPISQSVQPDYIVCLEDGKRLKMLKRYLRSRFDLTPEQYRQRWNLAPDYPMVAPTYAAARSQLAKNMGLGRGVGFSRER